MENEIVVRSIAMAIAIQEGYFSPGTPSNRNNNPGNLVKNWSKKLPNDGNFVVFKDGDHGWANLYVCIRQYIKGKYHKGKSPNLVEMFEKYAPAGHGNNDPLTYARHVSQRTGIAIDVPLDQY